MASLRGKTSEQLMDILLDDINHLRRTNMSWLEGRGCSFREVIKNKIKKKILYPFPYCFIYFMNEK